MKIRVGFVSNSSSSSFVVRGIRISSDKFRKIFNVPDAEEDLAEVAWSVLRNKTLEAHSTRYFFSDYGDRDDADLIIGESLGGLSDGEVTEFSMQKICKKDDSILKQLRQLGLEVTADDLSLYIQYVSNNNW